MSLERNVQIIRSRVFCGFNLITLFFTALSVAAYHSEITWLMIAGAAFGFLLRVFRCILQVPTFRDYYDTGKRVFLDSNWLIISLAVIGTLVLFFCCKMDMMTSICMAANGTTVLLHVLALLYYTIAAIKYERTKNRIMREYRAKMKNK